jgi:alpha-glucosidase (family GH31 glycosyl hydrolase)
MNLEEGFDARAKLELKNENLNDNPYAEAVLKEIKDQYMTGEYLLVAPLFTGQTSRKVVLPKGKWYDFYTGKYAGEGEVINVTPGLDKIPVYVKDGGIIPMMLPALQAPYEWGIKCGAGRFNMLCSYGSDGLLRRSAPRNDRGF